MINLRFFLYRDVTTGKFLVQPLQWLAESAPLGWDRVKVSDNLGATVVAMVAPVDISLVCTLLPKKLSLKYLFVQ